VGEAQHKPLHFAGILWSISHKPLHFCGIMSRISHKCEHFVSILIAAVRQILAPQGQQYSPPPMIEEVAATEGQQEYFQYLHQLQRIASAR
jgi:hypothetical protein